MDINSFSLSFLHAFSTFDFVEEVDLHSESFIIKGRAFLKKGRFLRVYFNGKTGTIAFALIENGKRIWGADCDSMRGWHIHPVNDPESHVACPAMNAEMAANAFAEAWKALP